MPRASIRIRTMRVALYSRFKVPGPRTLCSTPALGFEPFLHLSNENQVEAAALELTRNVVHAVKADPAVGENSLLYAAMGYVRRADRTNGRKRSLRWR